MNTPIRPRDLTQEPPHSPRVRLAGFVIANRAVDKCRAVAAGAAGEYRYDSWLDRLLFVFKGVTAEQFRAQVLDAKDYEDVGAWLLSAGTARTTAEIKAWSDAAEAANPMKDPARQDQFINHCSKHGLNPQMNTLFDLLEADDRATFLRPPMPHQMRHAPLAEIPGRT